VSTASAARPLLGEAEGGSQSFGMAHRDIWKCIEEDFIEFALMQEMNRYCSAKSLSGEKDLP